MPIVRANRWLWLGALACLTTFMTCFSPFSFAQPPACVQDTTDATANILSLPLVTSTETLNLLQQSWLSYRERFIQSDGRVIDRETNDRTVSEGQAYAMLRAVLINDRETFTQTLTWAENNLSRKDEKGERIDRLWAWKWGQRSDGSWGTIDANFASDADVDAAMALILAARRWNCPEYLEMAQDKLKDLWEFSTIRVRRKRYLLPGPDPVFRQNKDWIVLNPSYFAPYAFRLFDQVDRHNWMSLVESSYLALERSAALSSVKLPSDWVAMHRKTGEFQPVQPTDTLKTDYGFDAYRVWWRIAWDLAWFRESRADRYLQHHLSDLQQRWQTQQKVPAEIDLQGQPLVDYEATSQYGMLYFAFRLINPAIARQIYDQKLAPQYQDGFWESDSAYYTQNLAWFGLLPFGVPETLLHAQSRCTNLFSSLSPHVWHTTASLPPTTLTQGDATDSRLYPPFGKESAAGGGILISRSLS
jgi:endoglucanase